MHTSRSLHLNPWLAVTFASCLLAAATESAAYQCEVFPAIGGNPSPNAETSADGSVWYIAGERLIRVRDRKAAGVAAVNASTGRLSGLTIGPDGAVWFSKDKDARVGRLPLDGTPGTEFTIPEGRFLRGIRAGAGDLWFYDAVIGFVGRMSTSGAVRRYYGQPEGGTPFIPGGLAVTPDGAVWVSVAGHNAIYRLDPGSGQFRRFDIPTPGAQPGSVLADKDGSAWFTMPAVQKIGHVLTNGQVMETAVGKDSPYYLTWGPDGALWYTFPIGSRMGRVDPSGSVRSFRCGTNSAAMAIGPDGKLWAMGNNEIAVVDDAPPVHAAQTRVAVEPKTTVATQAAVALPATSKVSEVAIDGLAALLQALPGRTAVQFSSHDPKCGYCVPSNRAFDEESLKHPTVHFLRVHFEPWTSANSAAGSKPYHLTDLPTIVLFSNGKETTRLLGTLEASKLGTTLEESAQH
jgi:virginiamycin B lyase